MSTQHRSWVEILKNGQTVWLNERPWTFRRSYPMLGTSNPTEFEMEFVDRDNNERRFTGAQLWSMFDGYRVDPKVNAAVPAFVTQAKPNDYEPDRVVVDEITDYAERRKVEIQWSRIGKVHDADPIDISDLIDLDSIEERIAKEAGRFLKGEFTPILKISVKINGGGHRELPFGRGSIG